jgi:hypothetical protein
MKHAYSWEVEEVEGCIEAASGYCNDGAEAVREALHYATQYAQDGPVRWRVYCGMALVAKGAMCFPGKGQETK